MRRRGVLAAGLAAIPAALTACAGQACTRVADMALRLVDGYPLVPGSILGQPVSFLLDTGAQGMLVTPAIAEALQLPLRGMTRIYGTGGSTQARVVSLPGLRLGDAAMPAIVAPVAPLPIELSVQPPLAGLVGASLLARFDLDIDVPGNRVALLAPGTCPAPAWPAAPLEVSRAGEPFVAVTVNGETLLALVDTGSRATLLTQAAARRLRLAAPVSASTARGVDGERVEIEHVRVRLGLGPLAPVDVPVGIAALQLDRGDMLLGLDVLGRQRFWIGYERGEIRLG